MCPTVRGGQSVGCDCRAGVAPRRGRRLAGTRPGRGHPVGSLCSVVDDTLHDGARLPQCREQSADRCSLPLSLGGPAIRLGTPFARGAGDVPQRPSRRPALLT